MTAGLLSWRFLLLLASLLPLAVATRCERTSGTADLALVNGRIVTLDPARPEVRALASRDGTILATGSDDEIRQSIGRSTTVIDLHGHLAVPGFIEGHAHFLGLGRAKRSLDLASAATWDEVVARVEAAVRKGPARKWVVGRGWHQEKWSSPPDPTVGGYPVNEALDRVTGEIPVYLKHASGHAAIVNSAALALAGIGPATPNPPGGEIVRDRSGRPTGVLIEAATDRIERACEVADEQAMTEDVEAAEAESLAKGVTTFVDAGSTFETVDLLRKLAVRDRLKVRLWVMLDEPNDRLAARLSDYRILGAGNRHLTVRAIKRYMDGALGSHGAWLLQPYADLPTSRGLNVDPIPRIEEAARLAIAHGFQLCVHAIGDRANRETLDLYARTFRAHRDKKGLRWRIEHAQVLSPRDVARFARLGVIAAMQGIHCTSDGPWAIERLGEKRAREGAYVWRSLLETGAVVCNGTDAPVEDVDPIRSFHASVTRMMDDGVTFFPDQRMTRDEALRSYTLNAAYATFEEDVLGSLAPGKLADVTVLSKDILAVPDDEILGTKVLYTIVDGRIVYRGTE